MAKLGTSSIKLLSAVLQLALSRLVSYSSLFYWKTDKVMKHNQFLSLLLMSMNKTRPRWTLGREERLSKRIQIVGRPVAIVPHDLHGPRHRTPTSLVGRYPLKSCRPLPLLYGGGWGLRGANHLLTCHNSSSESSWRKSKLSQAKY